MSDNTVTLTIDDRTITVPKNMNVVDAAKTAGIEVPIFCYHEKMGQLGCCRMCLVEIEKMPKLMTACTTQVQEGMVIRNNTEKVEKGRKGVLEFTLLNHPLDCPVCDKGGECPLQDNTFKYGPDDTRMEFHRFNNIKKTPLSPVITLDRERCISCQRCTRYSEVIEQDQALVMLNRGFHNDIGTFNNEPYNTRFSGNVVDICPVGALTNTEFRFSARSWDLDNAKTLCAHCGCNCNITFGVRENELKRITGRTNDHVDDGWICDKGRWGYGFVHSKERILEPGCDKGSGLEITTLDEAVTAVAERLKSIVEANGPESVGFIGSPYGNNEELYLYQKLFRMQFKSNNIDHKIYSEDPGLPVPHYDLVSVESSDLILLISSDPTEELPILELRIKKAVTRWDTKLIILNDQKTVLDKYAEFSVRYDIGSAGMALAAVGNRLARELNVSSNIDGNGFEEAAGIDSEQVKTVVERLQSSKKTCVIYNPAALTGNAVDIVKRLMAVMNQIPNSECGAIPSAPFTNAVGALDMGVLPDYYPGGIPVTDAEKIKSIWGEEAPLNPGLSAMEMIEKAGSGQLKALVVYRANPVLDFPGGDKIKNALKKLDCVVVHDMLMTETSRLAHVVLPSNGPGYDEGTTTNLGGRVQCRRRGLTSKNPSDWKIISKILNVFGDETRYQDAFGVTAEIAKNIPSYGEIRRAVIQMEGKPRQVSIVPVQGSIEPVKSTQGDGLRLRVAVRLFANDKILEEGSALAHQFQASTVYIHQTDAKKAGIVSGDRIRVYSGDVELKARVEVGDHCNPGGMVIPRVSDEQNVLALASNGGVQLKR